jgi:hypothetical protein
MPTTTTPHGAQSESGLHSRVDATPTFEATVLAELPQQLYRLESSEGQLIAGPSEESKRLGMQYRTGQRVLVRRASLDPGRGIILGLSSGQRERG